MATRIYAQAWGDVLLQFVGFADSDSFDAFAATHPDCTFVPADVMGSPATHYLVDGAVVPVPAAPTATSRWVAAQRAYVEDMDLATARAAALQRIEVGRVSRTVAVYDHGGVQVDADTQAQQNIRDKLDELAQLRKRDQVMPVDQMFWRDAGNELHFFEGLDAYEAWLGDLLIALVQRGTAAYVWAWTQKAALAAATDLPAIAAIPSDTTVSTTTESTNP